MLGKTKFVVTRKAEGRFLNGKWTVSGSDHIYTMIGSLQPLTELEMQSLPEGRRGTISYKILSKTAMQYADVKTKRNSDTLVIDGEIFECVSVNKWQNGIINHYKNIIAKAAQ